MSRVNAKARVATDERGAVMAEYVVLIGTVALGSAAAFLTIGVALVNSFGFVRNLLLIPFP
jgi:Flp pilus assembly pilin Flp